MWTRYGTTTDSISVSYQNPDSPINLLGLIKLGNDWRISVRISSDTVKQYIQEALQAVGFISSVIEYIENDKEFVLQSYDLAPIINFINAMRPFMHSFIEIEPAVVDLLQLNREQHYTNPHWLRTSFGRGNILPAPHIYDSMNSDSTISQLLLINRPSIEHDRPNYKKIEVKTSTRAQLAQLETSLNDAHFPTSLMEIDRWTNTITLRNYDIPSIANFMKIIKLHALHFNEIQPEIAQRFGIDFNQEYPMPTPGLVVPAQTISQGPLTRMDLMNALQAGIDRVNRPNEATVNERLRLFGQFATDRQHSSHHAHTTAASTSMSVGKNALDLAGAVISEEIPDNYICPLSLSIMTEPAYLLGDATNQRFERSWIKTWLTQKGTHPITRIKFKSESVMVDENLKNEIDKFVQTAMSYHLGLKK